MLREERKHSEISKIKLTKYSILHVGKKNSLNESNIIKIMSSFMITNRTPPFTSSIHKIFSIGNILRVSDIFFALV